MKNQQWNTKKAETKSRPAVVQNSENTNRQKNPSSQLSTKCLKLLAISSLVVGVSCSRGNNDQTNITTTQYSSTSLESEPRIFCNSNLILSDSLRVLISSGSVFDPNEETIVTFNDPGDLFRSRSSGETFFLEIRQYDALSDGQAVGGQSALNFDVMFSGMPIANNVQGLSEFDLFTLSQTVMGGQTIYLSQLSLKISDLANPGHSTSKLLQVNIGIRNEVGGAAWADEALLLLPGFLANPNIYAAVNPGLAGLHPLFSDSASNRSSDDYKRLGDNLCN
ncbi:MAG: hypothetical protein COT74_12235 [Bdellovibrionales bacterium CG10_big_fil_rev_8_21_14_0_10_45_34]|nr:MAG: hypothetical protein COT74_12235 [Bdellovibrionales bacterium CG10_big_fil_rev_8_21_14_0_10_45_34]